jgi:hypothetical protein
MQPVCCFDLVDVHFCDFIGNKLLKTFKIFLTEDMAGIVDIPTGRYSITPPMKTAP